MGTPFISLLEPTRLDAYDARVPHSAQPHAPRLPPVFLDAMAVREAVYVAEQGVPLAHEHDADDARSCHWVAYASVNQTTTTTTTTTTTPTAPEAGPESEGKGEGEGDDGQGGQDDVAARPLARRSETRTVPIGTLRVVPFPHPPHPLPGARYVDNALLPPSPSPPPSTDSSALAATTLSSSSSSSSSSTTTAVAAAVNTQTTHTHTQTQTQTQSAAEQAREASALPFGVDRATTYHDGREPYVKLGRVAVAPEFRGLGIAAQLWAAARAWLGEHPAYFDPSVAGLGMDQLGAAAAGDIPKWNGLVCCHAQESAAGLYERWGFRVDEGMGRWLEEGMPHVGMFLRLRIKGTDPTI